MQGSMLWDNFLRGNFVNCLNYRARARARAAPHISLLEAYPCYISILPMYHAKLAPLLIGLVACLWPFLAPHPLFLWVEHGASSQHG